MLPNKTSSSLNGIFKEVYADALEDLFSFPNMFLTKSQIDNRSAFLQKHNHDWNKWRELNKDEKTIIYNKGLEYYEKAKKYKKDIGELLDG